MVSLISLQRPGSSTFPPACLEKRHDCQLTATSTALFIIVGLLFSPAGAEFELNRSLIRPIYLFVFGWMLSYWGGREIALKRRLLILQEIGSQWNPRLGVDRTISVNLERLVDFFAAQECILVLKRPTNPPTYFTYQVSNRKTPRASPPTEINGNEVNDGKAKTRLILLGTLAAGLAVTAALTFWMALSSRVGGGSVDERPLEGLQVFGTVPSFSLIERSGQRLAQRGLAAAGLLLEESDQQ